MRRHELRSTLLFVAGAIVTVTVIATQVIGSAIPWRTRPMGHLPGYDLSRPDVETDLPFELMEISALTDVDRNTVACLEDERGAIFLVDLDRGGVSREIEFGSDGDYEGLTRVGDAFWVLRSDGLLLEVVEEDGRWTVARRVELHAGHDEFEGLGYDPFDRTLLVAPKDRPSGGKHEKDGRSVLVIEPTTGRRLPGRALRTSIDRILSDAEAAGIPVPTRRTKKGAVKTDLKVKFSSIAVHPVTGELYAVSAIDAGVMVFDRQDRLCAAYFFDEADMPKIEGVTFLPNGDLVISSEGVGSSASLRVYRFRESAPACGGDRAPPHRPVLPG